ncbi:hypothetical protein R50072_05330 [Simiduia litorea]
MAKINPLKIIFKEAPSLINAFRNRAVIENFSTRSTNIFLEYSGENEKIV